MSSAIGKMKMYFMLKNRLYDLFHYTFNKKLKKWKDGECSGCNPGPRNDENRELMFQSFNISFSYVSLFFKIHIYQVLEKSDFLQHFFMC